MSCALIKKKKLTYSVILVSVLRTAKNFRDILLPFAVGGVLACADANSTNNDSYYRRFSALSQRTSHIFLGTDDKCFVTIIICCKQHAISVSPPPMSAPKLSPEDC